MLRKEKKGFNARSVKGLISERETHQPATRWGIEPSRAFSLAFRRQATPIFKDHGCCQSRNPPTKPVFSAIQVGRYVSRNLYYLSSR
jgi:hypothetical protein